MELAAQGMRVLVTAGAAGIGLAFANTFADAGARVFVCDIDLGALDALRTARPAIGSCVADVALPAQVDALFDAAAGFLGGLDVLINNAGIAGPTAPVEAIAIAEWERTIAVDLNGMFYCTRRAVPLLKQARGGSIINLSSVAGRLGYPLRTPYAAAKWAVVGFTKSLAMELGPANIRVNAIQPGFVEGERIERVVAAKAQALGVSPEEYRQTLLSKVSLRRPVSPRDVANLALFLASAAGRNISGQALSVCGNVEALA
jgi:NAD(P)-dependent dehydrogenase (short-subunit alcohol dehydrogenase family)